MENKGKIIWARNPHEYEILEKALDIQTAVIQRQKQELDLLKAKLAQLEELLQYSNVIKLDKNAK
jgi:BMFP domain-containing protein YqiC